MSSNPNPPGPAGSASASATSNKNPSNSSKKQTNIKTKPVVSEEKLNAEVDTASGVSEIS